MQLTLSNAIAGFIQCAINLRCAMKLNLRLYFQTLYYSFFKSRGTPGRLSPKRFLILCFIFLFYPWWHLGIRIAYVFDNLFFPEHQNQEVKQPIFIIGNFRSGTTLLHRLLTINEEYTSLTSWEIYMAPSIVGRKLLRWGMRVNRAIGNPAGKIIDSFERSLSDYSYLHKTSLKDVEEDGQVLFHTWSTYALLAFFPFPKLIRQYIYYDDQVPEDIKHQDMTYYHQVLKKHIYASKGKRYVSKNPAYSPKVRSLHQEFPDAKFINIVRSPLKAIPSSISLFSNHWHTYGDPKEDYALQDTIIEHAKHWYLYPHRYLKNLPPSQYITVRYRDLVADPKGTVERIYEQFGMEITPAYAQTLNREVKKAKSFRSKHKYSLSDMGLSRKQLTQEFAAAQQNYGFDWTEKP